MSIEANLVELHRLFRELTKENEALRALVTDYERLVEDGFGLARPEELQQWEARRIELKGRYEALVKGIEP